MTAAPPTKNLVSKQRWLKLRLWVGGRWTMWRFKTLRWGRRHAQFIECGLWFATIALGLLLIRPLQSALDSLLDKAGANAVRGYISGVGIAMVGATAIAASFILFALQVNVQRLPQGLFRKFSTDARLLWSVGASLLLAISGTALSLVSNNAYLAAAVLSGALLLVIILRLLLYAYSRSLQLIDPGEQIGILSLELTGWLRRWDRQVDLLAGLVEMSDDGPSGRRSSRTDFHRLAVFQANPKWTTPLKVSLGQLAAYAQRAGVSGDDETSAHALTHLLEVNRHYLSVKGRTFFANNLVIENALATDGVVNDTLERLRELVQAALARRDERQLRQVYKAMTSLVRVYANIEYASSSDSKSHAHLAAGYLKSAVQEVSLVGLTDTTMIGVQQLGQAALIFVADARPDEAVDLIKHIGRIGTAAIAKSSERPVALVAVEELRDLTLRLYQVQDSDPSFAFRQTREVVHSLVNSVLTMPDQSLLSGHSFYLGPYYSSTSTEALTDQLRRLANALLEGAVDEALAKRVVCNVARWADGLYQSQKEILLLAAKTQSRVRTR